MKLLPGRVLIQRDALEAGRDRLLASGLIVPATARDPRSETSHVGKVVAMGPPARTRRVYRDGAWIGGVEVPPGFAVGDEVVYVFALSGPEHTRTLGDGMVVVAQEEVIGVVE